MVQWVADKKIYKQIWREVCVMNKIKTAVYSVTATALSFSFFVNTALAAGFDVSNPPSGSNLPNKDANLVLVDIIKWILGILASLSILMIIVSGVMYITSAGDQGRIDTAKKMLTYSIVGLVVALLSYAIVKATATSIGAG